MGLINKIRKLHNNPERTKYITMFTMTYNFIWSTGKIVFGFFMRAYIFCISGLYTLLFGFIKKIFVSNHKSTKDIDYETKSLIMGILLTISGLTFSGYMIWRFFSPSDTHYGLLWSIMLATCSFIELGIAIYNLVKVKKQNDILLFSLRCCNLSASFFAIVLTQIALLSATNAQDTIVYNTITGVIAGLLVVITGFIVIAISAKKKQEKEINIEKTMKVLDDIVESKNSESTTNFSNKKDINSNEKR